MGKVVLTPKHISKWSEHFNIARIYLFLYNILAHIFVLVNSFFLKLFLHINFPAHSQKYLHA